MLKIRVLEKYPVAIKMKLAPTMLNYEINESLKPKTPDNLAKLPLIYIEQHSNSNVSIYMMPSISKSNTNSKCC